MRQRITRIAGMKTDIPKKVREAVQVRSQGICERIFHAKYEKRRCNNKATEIHHILARSQGGKHTEENLLHLCHQDHAFCKLFPALAIEQGLVAKAGPVNLTNYK